MKILTRLCMSADGYVTTPDGRPAQLADPSWDTAGYGFVELQARCDAVLMGRTTFEPTLADTWPWPDLDGAGMQLTQAVSTDTRLMLERAGTLRGGALELVCRCD